MHKYNVVMCTIIIPVHVYMLISAETGRNLKFIFYFHAVLIRHLVN